MPETTFDELAGVPVHYDRSAEFPYGSAGMPYTFRCQSRLEETLNDCFQELFELWPLEQPATILSAGTTGDGDNAHGQGLAFDLDGFLIPGNRFMMDEYPSRRAIYIGINAHLFVYFSQVLSYHYPDHEDHFHVDFNFSYRFRTASNAQTFFVQSALRYLYAKNLGASGVERDGVDGVYGRQTGAAVNQVLNDLGFSGRGGITQADVWRDFLLAIRDTAFATS